MQVYPDTYAKHGDYGDFGLSAAIIAAVTTTVGFVGNRISEHRTRQAMAEAGELEAQAAASAKKQAREAMRISALQGYYQTAQSSGQLALAHQAAQMQAAESAGRSANIAVLVMGAVGLVSVLAILKGDK